MHARRAIRFDHYITVQKGNPRWVKAIIAASIASLIITSSLIIFMWVANKMSITRVDPPTQTTVVVQMMVEDSTPPPPPPPPPPAGSVEPEPEEEEEVPEEDIPLEEIVQPKETPDKIPDKDAKGPKVPKVPGGIPGGVVGGVPGGVVGGVVGGQLGGVPGGVAVKRDTDKEEVAKQPISVVKGNALFSPDPSDRELQGTPAAALKRPGSSHVAFCVSTAGKVVDVRTTRKFAGDPKVDQICRETVKKWRFKPLMAGGKPVKTCSTVEFQIKFD